MSDRSIDPSWTHTELANRLEQAWRRIDALEKELAREKGLRQDTEASYAINQGGKFEDSRRRLHGLLNRPEVKGTPAEEVVRQALDELP
jgi:queuine/archaeosine tRNA-ribosyltransferase